MKKNPLHKLVAWLQLKLTLHSNPSKPKKRGGFSNLLFDFRVAQAYAVAQTCEVAWLGNSRWMQFEPFVDKISGWFDAGVGGAKISDYLYWGPKILTALRTGPKTPIIFDDLGGNDFLNGSTVSEVLQAKTKLIAMYRSFGVRVICSEICLLNQKAAQFFPNWKTINLNMEAFNNAMSVALGQDFVKVNDILAPKGEMLDKYSIADGIHHTSLANDDAYLPRFKEKL